MAKASEAKRQADILDDLGTLGEDRSNFETKATLPNVEALLALYAEEFLMAAKQKLIDKNAISSGDLESSLEFKVTRLGQSYTLQLLALDYFEFVDQGVQGIVNSKNKTSPFRFRTKYVGKTMATAVLKWIRTNVNAGRFESQTKNLSQLQKKRKSLKEIVSKADDLKQLAYAVSMSIKKKGIRRTGFWTDSFDKTFKGFEIEMSKALGQDISVDLTNLVRGVKKKR